jgi:polysaccharide chain length determinant protein (PEP-CTERM system associated)
MVRNGEIGIEDIKRVVRKRWWIVPVCAIGFGAASLLVATQLPKKYTSQTVVLVAKPSVPEDVVRPVVTEDLNQRLVSMKQQILSRTRLEPVLEKFDLYHEDRKKVHVEDLIERLRTTIEITPLEPMPGTQDRNLPGFKVGVTFDSPQTAQQICTEITSMFIEQNGKVLEQRAVRTTSFLGQQLDQAKAKLDEQDAKLAEFKRRNMGVLPEEEQTNFSLLGSMNAQLESNTQSLSRAQQDRAFHESLLNQEETNWKATRRSEQNPETIEEQLRNLQGQLTSLESRYTAEHPDVVKMKNQIAELKKKLAETPSTDSPSIGTHTAADPPQIQKLRGTLRQDDFNIGELTKRQGQIQDQIKILEGRIQSSPMVEQQLKELTRNYQSALDFYNELLKKQQNSAMATDLTHQQQGEQFNVLDAPSLPTQPSFPKIMNFAGGGLGGGAALGLAILYVLMAMDQSLHTERDVEVFLKLPVLTSVPRLEVAEVIKKNGDAARPSVVQIN